MDIEMEKNPQDPISQPLEITPKPRNPVFIIFALVLLVVMSVAGGFLLKRSLPTKITPVPTAHPTGQSPTVTIVPTIVNPTTEPSITATPTIDEKELLKSTIKDSFMAKYGPDAKEMIIAVTEISGNYAKGTANDQGGGGAWFAARVNGTWKLVTDGNGVTPCSDLTPYPDFPSSMIPQCWNESTQSLVTR